MEGGGGEGGDDKWRGNKGKLSQMEDGPAYPARGLRAAGGQWGARES